MFDDIMNIDKIIANVENESKFMELFNKYANEFDLDYSIIGKTFTHCMLKNQMFTPKGLTKRNGGVFLFGKFSFNDHRPSYNGIVTIRSFQKLYCLSE